MAIDTMEGKDATLRILIEAINEGALTLAAEGFILTCNNRLAQMINLPVEQIVESHWHKFFPENEYAALQRLLEKARHVASQEEFTLQRGGGSCLAVELSMRALNFEEGEVFLVMVTDLSERREHEYELCESEQRFRLLADEIRDYAIIMLDPVGRVTDWNVGAQQLTGYSRQEILGQSCARFYTPEDVEQDKPRWNLERAAAEGHFEDEGWRVRKDRSRFQAGVVITALHASGKLVGYSKLVRDLTERKRLEQELKLSAKELKEAQRLANVGSWEWIPEPDIATWSEELYRIAGLNSKQPAPGLKDLSHHLTPESMAQVEPLLRHALETGAPFEVDLELVRPDGTHRWITNRVEMGEKDHSGKITKLRGTVQDITAHRQAQEILKNSERGARGTIDALSAHICVLDDKGTILETNKAWQEFAFANGATTTYEGVNYLAVCDAVRGPDAQDAAAFAAGIRAVMKGEQERFCLEYACHSPEEKRWFNGRVSRFSTPSARFAVAHETITEVKLATEALRQSEERFRSVFASAAVGLAIEDLQGCFVDVNPAYSFITGYSREELMSRDFSSITYPEDRQRCMNLFRQMLNGETSSFVTQKRYVTKGGGIVWVQISASLFSDAQGRPVNSVVIAEDITERKWAEESLRHAKGYAENIIQSANVMIVGLDPSATIQVFNQVAEQISGYRGAEVVGRSWFETLVPAERYPKLRDELLRLMAGEEPWDYENCILTKEGKERMISWRNNQIRENGRIAGTLSFGIDITERQRSEESLRRSEERFRTMAETVPEFIFTCRADGWTDYCNGAFYRYTGLSPGSAAGFAWLELVHPQDHERVKTQWLHAIRSGQNFEAQYRLRGADGEYRWFLSRKRPIRGLNNEVVQWQGVSTDIEEQKRAEEVLENRVAQRTAKLQEAVDELEQFSFSITHDLRAPLRAIQGFTRLIKEESEGTLSAANQDYLQRIMTSSERMENLIRDSLNYGKILQAEFKLESIDVATLVLDIIQAYPALQSPRAEVTLEGEFPRILGNDAALAQCVSNLLLNAVKFVAPGTLPRVRVRAEPRDEWVRLWFEDNGIGIPKDVQDRIFGMFQQLDKRYEGTGIGLAIVRKAADRMGGKVGVISEPGQGSRFWLDLKRAT